MAKINLNYDSIRVNGINSLDNAINYLNTAINYLQQNSIPNDFPMYRNFIGAIEDLKKQRSNLRYFKDWIVNSNKNYDSLITKLESNVSKLPSHCVKRRSSIIR